MNSDEFLKSSDLRVGYIKRIGQAWRPVVYAAVDGMAVFEGCIILGTVEEMETAAETVRRQPMLLSDPDAEPLGVAIKGVQFRWPGKKCFYEIDPNLPETGARSRCHRALGAAHRFPFLQTHQRAEFHRFSPRQRVLLERRHAGRAPEHHARRATAAPATRYTRSVMPSGSGTSRAVATATASSRLSGRTSTRWPSTTSISISTTASISDRMISAPSCTIRRRRFRSTARRPSGRASREHRSASEHA